MGNGQRPVEAGCLASGFERFCPLGGRDGLACGKPLQRWGQGITTENPGNGAVGESVSLTLVINSPIPARCPFDENRCSPTLRP